MDRIQDLEAFVTIVEAGTLTAAARKLSRSLQSVSRSLATLEKSVGAELIRRTTRQSRPTDAGQQFYERLRPLLTELAEARMQLWNDETEPAGRITLGAPLLFGARRVAPLVAKFAKRHPKITINCALSDSFSNLIDADIDLTIRMGTLTDSSLKGRRLGTLRLCYYSSRDYLAQRGRPSHPRELANHDCIIRTSDREPGRWPYMKGKTLSSVNVQGRFYASDTSATYGAVSEGLGIGFGPLWQIQDKIDDGTFELILERFEPPPVPIHILWPASKQMRSRVRLLIDYLADNLLPIKQL